ncbi:hypothetical protein A6R68_18670 [Neotoma lepida]|uniref:Uncharacterized protein n=1 Tax=Neotoma lepida TaxID=56216 RepID=A0A1A6HLT9_NEOLE|nr:hypothetical protein A6R68_18670 [Neotoma lepida]
MTQQGCATSPLPDPGDHHARPGKNPGPSAPHPNLQGGGQRAIFSAPQSTWVTSPRRPGGREASEVARPSHQPPLPPETATPAPRPVVPRCRRTRPGKSRGGERRAAAPVPRSPPTSRSRARRALPGRPLPSLGGGERPGPGFHGAEKAAARRTPGGRGGRNPGALGRAAASLPSPPGRPGPSAACASSGWRFGWAGPGSPAPGRPNPAGAQAPSRGRQGAGCGAGRPAGGRAACCGCAGAEIAGDCAVGHSPQSGCATVGLRRGDCDRAGSSQPPATSGNGERCRLCRRRRRRGGGGEGGGTHATHGSASPPGHRHDGDPTAAPAAAPGRGLSAAAAQTPPGRPGRPLVPLCSLSWGRDREGSWMSKPWARRPSGSCGPKWLLIRRGPRRSPQRGELGPPFPRGSPTSSSVRSGSQPRPLSEMTFASLFQSP